MGKVLIRGRGVKFFRHVAFLVVILCSGFSIGVSAADKAEFSMQPVDNDGKRWRIGYFEGGEYYHYQKTLLETVKGLMKLGWVEKIEIPYQQGEQTEQLWQWLASDLKSDYIEFVKNAHYSTDWDEDKRDQVADQIIQRLSTKQEIDLMIAMGTWAGKKLANDGHHTATMVLSSSDPIAAGIIKSMDDSGYEHVHATVDPNRFEREIKVFHELISFKRLGVAYEDTQDGRSYAAVDELERLSKERNFELVRCYTKSDISETAEAEASIIDCFRQLTETAEAIYVTDQGGITLRSIPELVSIANAKRIPTFYQPGSEGVKQGFLLSLSRASFRYIGEFQATTFAKVFNGALPNQISQFYEQPLRMAINLKTAEIVGFNPPMLLLGAADEIYREIP